MKIKILTAVFFLFFSVATTKAKVVLPAVLSDNMVLQQNTEVKLWGTADKNKIVEVVASWSTEKYSSKSDASGKWLLKIKTPVAGGPHTLTFNDGSGNLALDNVMTGEVWLCSGQSNMEMPMKGFPSQPVLNSNEIISRANNPNLRLMKVGRNPSLAPLEDVKGVWKISTPEAAREFSAIAYQFGEMLQKQLKVPVGIIVSSVGGTKIECWMSKEILKTFPEVKIPERLDAVKQDFKEPTVLFNSMIYPLTNFAIKGWLWYQGESNRSKANAYSKLFPAMVADWRKRWDKGELPFYYTELAPLESKSSTGNGVKMRYVQLQAMEAIPNSGMAVINDAGMKDYVHAMDKTTVARRLGYWALGNTYGIKGISYRSPIYKSHKTEGNKLIVSFEHFSNGMTSYGKEITLFELAGNDGNFYPATATLTKSGNIEVQAKEVEKPVSVRYAWKDWVVGEVYNTDGLPLPSFTTISIE
ncbi:sialate O-acetylesterase [Pseudopedobacter beijingensis]|uniref:Sialate O-acetylesterase n=1 Tax=Pseudopedobacter beijingensis TaxID=1207056 RepID=A0ABW4I8Y6_9SPHI